MIPRPPPPVAGAVIVMPVLPPRSSELLAANVAPPVKVTRWKAAHAIVGAFEATLMVVIAAPLAEPNEIGKADVPVKVSVVIVLVTDNGKTIFCWPLIVNVAKVFAPVTERLPPEVLESNVTLA